MIHFHFVTLFPPTVESWLTASILGRARERGLFDFTVHQLRDYSEDAHRRVDDTAFGGGGGMVLRLEPLVAAVEAIRNQATSPCETIYFSPAGERLSQSIIGDYHGDRTLILICGHYEGVDERFIEGWVDRQVSLGDFVLTGGELPALAFADGVIRQQEGCLERDQAARAESFTLQNKDGTPLLEYPHYTRPREFRGRRVPDVLLEGDHGAIARWRHEQSVARTSDRRPDLMERNVSAGSSFELQ